MTQQPPFLDSYEGLRTLAARLRGPGGCPWDQEQTHTSLKRNLLEECYEVLEAIDQEHPGKLREELGDLLVQIAFHCQMAEEAGEFQTEEVFHGINTKLVSRHPHVFGDATVTTAEEVEANWDALKRQERGTASSLLNDVPLGLPALAQSQILQDRASRAGFDGNALEASGRETSFPEGGRQELGDLLFSIVSAARKQGLHAEDALRQANIRFTRRFAYVERRCQERGLVLAHLPSEEKAALWEEAKRTL